MGTTRTSDNKKRLTKMWVAFAVSNLIVAALTVALALTSDMLATISVAVMGLAIANYVTVPRLRRAIRDEPDPKPNPSNRTDYGNIITDHSS